jgi:hypothetical protein
VRDGKQKKESTIEKKSDRDRETWPNRQREHKGVKKRNRERWKKGESEHN